MSLNTVASPSPRFPSWTEIEALLTDGQPFRIVVPGQPRVELFGCGGQQELGFRAVDMSGSDLTPSPLRAVRVERVALDGLSYVQIATSVERLHRDFYSMGCLFGDRVQLLGLKPQAAVSDLLAALSELVSLEPVLSDSQQVGLLGELWVLTQFADRHGWIAAIQSWIAPEREQHDFAWRSVDLEVKTTAAEGRVHVIHGLDQLRPNPGRSLYLVSIQLTRTGSGGQSLPEAIQAARASVSSSTPGLLTAFNDRAQKSGWKDQFAPWITQSYVFRSLPTVTSVADIPAITSDVLDLNAAELGRIDDVRYRLNVQGLGTEIDDLPSHLDSA